jgi:hypothetical protein
LPPAASQNATESTHSEFKRGVLLICPNASAAVLLASNIEHKSEGRMQRTSTLKSLLLAFAFAAASAQPAKADFDLTDATGRRILLWDKGTCK